MDVEALSTPGGTYRELSEESGRFAMAAMPVAQTPPDDVATVVVEAATTDEPRFRRETSESLPPRNL
ncbi:hypothetical protein [Streptomyces iconiensis]|uniref:Uncharacterized protein n=1 Tax=Streptomyces iconiensis TaxID=1384038 RepID=A0ABT7A5K4_9ACTN|nr:hypothetical protein [Streptomyces iconiensis]MDJ1136627.1 hypothetical protein [Streptomyces iconiensis]